MAAGIWITVSEFLRNEILFKNYWVEHYGSLGLKFATLPINGLLWMVWSFALAFMICKLLEKFSFHETMILAWLSAFVMMWITIYNLQVLPILLLIPAIPLSLVEVIVAGWIIKRLA